jgi:UDP-N-acetylglucosamine 2-epimerase (non-hydrolysing)
LPTILFIFGTRPEVIKMAPLIFKMMESPNTNAVICSTGQHRQMLRQVLRFFELKLDFDLRVMKRNQNLTELTTGLLKRLESVLLEVKPDLVCVQGDTTTTVAGALSAFYHGVKVAHIEAGLRTYDKSSPFPEEMNRSLTSRLADYHFAPTRRARENLMKEGIASRRIFMVGNTVIDSLYWGLDKLAKMRHEIIKEVPAVDPSKKLILVTGHRRESFGQAFLNICLALKEIAERNDVEVVYPVHMNPNVVNPVYSVLSGVEHVHLVPPVSYPAMLYLMDKSYMILTDSGGVQEEAPSLKKPVLVMRDVTERAEGVEAGVTKLVGTECKSIVKEASLLLDSETAYREMAKGINPYGDGKASARIRKVLERIL